MNRMKIPTPASDLARLPEQKEEAIFMNPYHGKDLLTRQEAIDAINLLSGEILANEYIKREEKYPRHLQTP